jgi:predicted transcriptional regulator
LYNKIVKLGLVGKQMGQFMTSYQIERTLPNNRSALENSSVDYDYAWADVHKSPEYANLSREDKALVQQLADQSIRLADDVIAANGEVINADKTVDENSDRIIVCGQFEKCNP